MGCNYYLYKKERITENCVLPSSVGCGDYNYTWETTEPRKLKNGWVYHNEYFPGLRSLNKNFIQKIHIGKASYGWRFYLCLYPEFDPQNPENRWLRHPIESLNDWIKLFKNVNCEIRDECENIITADEMIRIITERKGDVTPDQDGWRNFGVVSYRVINGLCVHDTSREIYPSKERDWTTIMPNDCTYDTVISGNNSEHGLIFS